jgi:hypothetical protein
MRLAVLALLLAACSDPTYVDPRPPNPLPDAYVTGCGIGAFQIAAPKQDLHYAPAMVVYIDEKELQGSLDLTMVDDAGTHYQWTHDDSQQPATDAGAWWSHDSFWYDLAPGHRYTLSVSHGCPSDDQSVTFFTSAQ